MISAAGEYLCCANSRPHRPLPGDDPAMFICFLIGLARLPSLPFYK